MDSSRLLPVNRTDIIEGRNLLIRPISINEINQRYVGWLNDPGINQFLEVRHSHQTIESIIDYINGLRLKNGSEMFAILSRKEQIHIGNITITNYNPNQQRYVDFGIMIGDSKAQDVGLGGQAMVLLMEYLFSDLTIIRVECGAIADNQRSWKTLEVLGLRKEGILRKRSILASGKITDVYLYGLLREEWYEQRKKFAVILKDIKISRYNPV
ncbi:MAG: GNAT family protein [Candidatus Omnitrophota bacterium]|nr:GNAT family protein [Candidatus Omnitrophota bacterium]